MFKKIKDRLITCGSFGKCLRFPVTKKESFESLRLPLDKISCTRQFESKLSLRSFAKSLAKGSSTSNQAFSIVFTTPSVPLVGDRNLRRKDVTALLGARNRYAIRLAGHQSSRHILRDGTAGRGKFIVNSLHVYATCLRTHIIKHMIISVICTNIRKDNKFKWLS